MEALEGETLLEYNNTGKYNIVQAPLECSEGGGFTRTTTFKEKQKNAVGRSTYVIRNPFFSLFW